MRSFKTRFLSAAVVAGALAATSWPAAFAAGPNPYAGQPNCHGQTISHNNHAGLPTAPGQNVGVGEVADFLQDRGMTFATVKFLQGTVDKSCGA